jgi:hypothetical protein
MALLGHPLDARAIDRDDAELARDEEAVDEYENKYGGEP